MPGSDGKMIFFARSASNYYNAAKGLWRPEYKKKRKRITRKHVEKSINILSAYGEYDQFKKFSQSYKGGRSKSVS